MSQTEDFTDEYNVRPVNGKFHVIAKGAERGIDERYIIDPSDKTVVKLVFNDIPVKTMDFSTQYGYSNLLNNLLVNIRQYMLNEIVQ